MDSKRNGKNAKRTGVRRTSTDKSINKNDDSERVDSKTSEPDSEKSEAQSKNNRRKPTPKPTPIDNTTNDQIDENEEESDIAETEDDDEDIVTTSTKSKQRGNVITDKKNKEEKVDKQIIATKKEAGKKESSAYAKQDSGPDKIEPKLDAIVGQKQDLARDEATIEKRRENAAKGKNVTHEELDVNLDGKREEDVLQIRSALLTLASEQTMIKLQSKRQQLLTLTSELFSKSFKPTVKYRIVDSIIPYVKYNCEYDLYTVSPPKVTGDREFLNKPSLDTFKYGTRLITFKLRDDLEELLWNPPRIVTSNINAYSKAKYSSALLAISLLIAQDNAAVKVSFRALDHSTSFTTDMQPEMDMISPVLVLPIMPNPNWYVESLNIICARVEAQVGKIGATDIMSSKTANIVAAPVDQWTAAINNHNALKLAKPNNMNFKAQEFIRAHIPVTQDIIANHTLFPVVQEIDLENALLYMTLNMCVTDNWRAPIYAMNYEYIDACNIFTIQDTNPSVSNMTMILSSAGIEPSFQKYFSNCIGTLQLNELLVLVAGEITPQVSPIPFDCAEISEGDAAAVMVVFEMIALYILFPNQFIPSAHQAQRKILMYIKAHFRDEYRKFVTNFGFTYTKVGGVYNYNTESDASVLMSDSINVYNTKYYLSLFTDDPQLARICPIIGSIAAHFKRDHAEIEDTRALTAGFPRFKGRAYHYFGPKLTTNSRSPKSSNTGVRLVAALDTIFELVDKTPGRLFAQSSSKRIIQQIKDELVRSCEYIGQIFDIAVIQAYMTMQNWPCNIFSSTDGDINAKPVSYCVTTKKGTILPFQNEVWAPTAIASLRTSSIISLLLNVSSPILEKNGVRSRGGEGISVDLDWELPPADAAILAGLSYLNTVERTTQVLMLTSLMISGKEIDGYGPILRRIYEGLYTPHDVNVHKFVTALFELLDRERKEGGHAPLGAFAVKRSLSLLDPRIRYYRDGIAYKFDESRDPNEFRDDIISLKGSFYERWLLGLKFLDSPLFKVYKGLIVFISNSVRSDFNDTAPIDNTYQTIKVTPNLLSQDITAGVTLYALKINNKLYTEARKLPKCKFVVDDPLLLPPQLKKLLCDAVQFGGCAIYLSNTLYMPYLTTVKVPDEYVVSLSDIFQSHLDTIFRIGFYDNTANPDTASNDLPSHNDIYRAFWPVTKISDVIAAKSIINKNSIRPEKAMMHTDSEFELGDINAATGIPMYRSGSNKTSASQISMLNKIYTLSSNITVNNAIQYKTYKVRASIPIASHF